MLSNLYNLLLIRKAKRLTLHIHLLLIRIVLWIFNFKLFFHSFFLIFNLLTFLGLMILSLIIFIFFNFYVLINQFTILWMDLIFLRVEDDWNQIFFCIVIVYRWSMILFRKDLISHFRYSVSCKIHFLFLIKYLLWSGSNVF